METTIPRVNQEQELMAELLDEFKAFVLDSMHDEMHKDFVDDLEFLSAAFKTWHNSVVVDDYVIIGGKDSWKR